MLRGPAPLADVFGSQRICIELSNGLRCHGTLCEFLHTPKRFAQLQRMAESLALAPALAAPAAANAAYYGGLHGPCLAPARISVPYKTLSQASRTVIVNLIAAGAHRARDHELAHAFWQWFHDTGAHGLRTYWRCVATVHRYLACSAGKNYYIGTLAMADANRLDLFDAHADSTLPASHAGALCLLRLTMLTKRTSHITFFSALERANGYSIFNESAMQHTSLKDEHIHYRDAVTLYNTGVAFEQWFRRSAYRKGRAIGVVMERTGRSKTLMRVSRTASQLFAEFCTETGNREARRLLYDRPTRPRSMLKQTLCFFLYRALRSLRCTGVRLVPPTMVL